MPPLRYRHADTLLHPHLHPHLQPPMEFADTVKNNMQHLNSEGGIKVEQENVRMVEEEDNDDDDDKKIKFNEEDDVDDKMVEVDDYDDDDEGDEEEQEEQEEDDDDGDYDEGDTEEEDNANDDDDEGDKEDDNDNNDVVREAWAAFAQIEARVALLQEWITADILNGWLWEVELMEKGKLFNIYMTYPSHSS